MKRLPFFFALFLISLTPDLILGASMKPYQGSYPGALANNHLKERIAGDKDRLLPSTDLYTLAIDSQVYHRNLGANDFYHGTGYWIQARTEISPNEYIDLNVRSIFFLANSSAGYAQSSGSFHQIGFSGKWPTKVFGGTIDARILDLERQTIGSGLLVQNREFFGGMFTWQGENLTVRIRDNGTGAIVLDEDITNLEIGLWEDLIGIGGVIFPENFRDPYAYIYSNSSPLTNTELAMEVGFRNSQLAALVAVSYERQFSKLHLRSKAESRWYANDFGKDFTGETDQDYVAYEQYDKPYTNTLNVFTKDDNAVVFAAQLDLSYRLSHEWRFHSLNEIGIFDYRQTTDDRYYFFRVGVANYPLPNREDSIVFFVSNKVLTDSFFRPPTVQSDTNNPVFFEHTFTGIEGNFKF